MAWVRCLMPPNTLRVYTEYVLVKYVGPKVLWAESRAQMLFRRVFQDLGAIFVNQGLEISPQVINKVRTQASLRPLVGRLVIRERMLLKNRWEPWRCGMWFHLVVTAHYQDPFIGVLEEHDFGKEYRSDGERPVAVQPPTDRSRNTPPRKKRAVASTTTCMGRRLAGTQISNSSADLLLKPFLSLRTSLRKTFLKKESPPAPL
ncbi:hypothetical protein TNCV_781911 [Trichonephila clavipes]|nr:hypothetical protein TNCV_781911 [Trichonephila clavipes]